MTRHDEAVQRVLNAGSLAKLVLSSVVGIITIVVVVLLWVQTQGDEKYYPKSSGEHLEARMGRMEQRLTNIESGNGEILRILGRLEGSIKHEP